MRILIIGAGGHGQVVADLVRQMHGYEVLGFLDDDPKLKNREFHGYRVLGPFAEIAAISHEGVIVAVGDNRTRCLFYEELRNRDESVIAARHPRAIVAPDVSIGPGTMICANVVVNIGSMIGANTILNTACNVDHHNRIGDHVHIGPGATLGGTVRVEEGALIGIGATVLPRTHIGAWSIVGGGACVTRPVAANTKVVGAPARPIHHTN